MRFVFTKDNLKRLSIDMIPVVEDGRFVDVEPALDSKPYIVYDDDRNAPQGFGFYVGKTKRTFVLQVRVGSQIKKVAVGDYPRINVNMGGDIECDARAIATEVRAALKRGIDIQSLRSDERAVIGTTLKKIFDDYLGAYKRRHDKRDNSIKAIEAAMRRLKPWMGQSVRSIGGDTVKAIWKAIAEDAGHKTAAEQTLMWCRAAFNEYIRLEYSNRNLASNDGKAMVNPFLYSKNFIRTRKQLEQEYKDKGVRNPLENTPERLGVWLDAVWQRRSRNRKAVDYMLLTLLTGTRKSETAKLVWSSRLTSKQRVSGRKYSEVDFQGEMGTGRLIFRETKNGSTHIVPMGRFVTWLLRERERDSDGELYVFPSSSKNPQTETEFYNSPREFVYALRDSLDKDARMSIWEPFWLLYLAREGLDESAMTKQKLLAATSDAQIEFDQDFHSEWNFSMHDMRRTFCTVAVNIEGIPYAVVQQLMNHGQMNNITARYGQPSWDMLCNYMQRLEDELLKHGTALPKLKD